MANPVRKKMTNTVTKIETGPPQGAAATTPMDLLNQAVATGNIELAEKLMALQERWEKNQARRAFDEAIAAAKAEIKPVAKTSTGHNEKRYADFAAIALAVDPVITKHGLSYRFRTAQTDTRISVTCVLSHKAGHSEETTLSGPADTSGNKNAIQAIGSTLTYLQRYSLVQMLGLAASDDDDGKLGGAGEKISEQQLAELIALADDVGVDKEKFCKYFKIGGMAELPISKLKNAIDAINAKRKA